MAKNKLTNDQVTAIADRLHEVVGNEFHNELCTALNQYGWGDIKSGDGISDMDVYKVKMELALGYLKEYQYYYNQKHENE
jgi:hypothetical protein|tara:strand:- start:12136 stop:12375 length:240 start_codon:yes stop_codon:yes gene_type:complete